MRLKVIPNVPKDIYKFSTEQIADVESNWSATFIGVLVGNKIPYFDMVDYLKSHWQIPPLKLFYKDNGIMVLKFRTKEDRMWVLENGPWLIEGNKPLILKE